MSGGAKTSTLFRGRSLKTRLKIAIQRGFEVSRFTEVLSVALATSELRACAGGILLRVIIWNAITGMTGYGGPYLQTQQTIEGFTVADVILVVGQTRQNLQ